MQANVRRAPVPVRSWSLEPIFGPRSTLMLAALAFFHIHTNNVRYTLLFLFIRLQILKLIFTSPSPSQTVIISPKQKTILTSNGPHF